MHPHPGRDIDRLVVQAVLSGKCGIGLGTIRAEHGIASDHGAKHRRDGCCTEIGQYGVNGVAGAVAGDQRRDLLGREPALAGALAAAVGTSLKGCFGAPPAAGAFMRAAKKPSRRPRIGSGAGSRPRR